MSSAAMAHLEHFLLGRNCCAEQHVSQAAANPRNDSNLPHRAQEPAHPGVVSRRVMTTWIYDVSALGGPGCYESRRKFTSTIKSNFGIECVPDVLIEEQIPMEDLAVQNVVKNTIRLGFCIL